MFNFLLQGKIGEFVAPISNPEDQLFLSLESGNETKALQLIEENGVSPISRNKRSGATVLLIAALYNCSRVIDSILFRGASLDETDNSGNTVLHYASLGGHLDLVKRFVEMGCDPARRNSLNQTPYDVSQRATVQQYLLPLQLKAEHNSGYTSDSQFGNNFGLITGNNTMNAPTITSLPPPSFPPPSYSPSTQSSFSGYPPQVYSPYYSQQQLQQQPQQPPQPPQQPPQFMQPYQQQQFQQPQQSQTAFQSTVKADGFQSSAGDVRLQEKYGHIKEAPKETAPPPLIAPAPQQAYSVFSNRSFNRYVNYDPINNSSTIPGTNDAFQPQIPPLTTQSPNQMHPTYGYSVPSQPIHVFNPATDNVVSASSESSSIL